MRALLDVNVLVALLDPQHGLYIPAMRWLDSNLASGWASYPLTENGCLRILTSSRYPDRASAEIVLAGLEKAKQASHHDFWSDDLSITNPQIFDWGHLRGHQQVPTFIYSLWRSRTADGW